MNFKSICLNIIEEKRAKLKPLTGLDYYKSIRKPTPQPGTPFKDKSVYTRKQKHKTNNYEQ